MGPFDLQEHLELIEENFNRFGRCQMDHTPLRNALLTFGEALRDAIPNHAPSYAHDLRRFAGAVHQALRMLDQLVRSPDPRPLRLAIGESLSMMEKEVAMAMYARGD